MKAIVFEQYGSPDMLHMAQVPDPIARPDEIVVLVRAASVNGADAKVRQGGGPYKATFPHILGRDFSGIVASVGDAVHDLRPGDEVFGVLDQGVEGAYAEKVRIRAALVARKPAWLGHTTAAAVALAGITALWAIEDTARLQRAETILIHGGAGGVGGFAVQIARYIGAWVITTASVDNHDYVRALGADQVIDYNRQDFVEAAQPCDVVFDTVGGQVQIRSYDVLKPDGRLIWIAAAPEGYKSSRSDVSVERPAVYRDRAHLERIVSLLESGAVTPPPIQTFSFAQAAQAHRISESRHLRGKLVLHPEN